jgi:ornithine carbamoyltransferase
VQTHLRGRDLITLQEWTKAEIETALDVGFDLKRDRALGRAHPILRDKVLAMLFFYASTRTRASFEAGMAQLGGHAQFIESRTTQIAHGDTAKEIGEILGRYNDGIAIRHVDWGVGNAYIRDVAEASRVPVLNLQCDLYHPHQALADLMTIVERFGDLRGRTITVSWAYAASYQKPISVPQSLVLLMPRFGMNVRLVHPPEFPLLPEVVEQARENARRARVGFEVLHDFEEGLRGADVVYAKSWGALVTTTDEEEGKRLIDKYPDWIVDERRMALAGEDAIYMHPLPADRNVEVADAVIDGPRSVVYDQAENRLHAQKAVMALTMS